MAGTIVWSKQQEAIFRWFEQEPAEKGTNLVIEALAGSAKTTTVIEGVSRCPEVDVLVCAFNKRIAEHLQDALDEIGAQADAKTMHALGFAAIHRHVEGVYVDARERMDFLVERALLDTGHDPEEIPYDVKRMLQKLITLAREAYPHASSSAASDSAASSSAPSGEEGTWHAAIVELAQLFDCEPESISASPARRVPSRSGGSRGDGASGGYGGEGGRSGSGGALDTPWIARATLHALEVAAEVEDGMAIDFSDMLFLPTRLGWLKPRYDLVVIDEAQDLNRCQLEMATSVCRPSGHICVVGDSRQAIYGFRGADSTALSRMKEELAAISLPLTTTYRCAQKIAAEAQRYAPELIAFDANPEGVIRSLSGADELRADVNPVTEDFVLSRKNAPLAGIAMSLIRQRTRVRIAGKDIGQGLVNLIQRLTHGPGRSLASSHGPGRLGAGSLDALDEALDAWEVKEVKRVMKTRHPERADGVHDRADTIRALMEGATSVQGLIADIQKLFSDTGRGAVVCSTIHRSKGLEAQRVFILTETLGGWAKTPEAKQEELNIAYVACTRAREELIYVGGIS